MLSYPVVSAFLFAVLVLFLIVLYFNLDRKDSEQEIKDILEGKKTVSSVFPMGKYVSGLDLTGEINPLESRKMLSIIPNTAYVFMGFPRDSWEKVGEISLDAIQSVFIENKKICVQAFSEIKRNEEWRLFIEWKDEKGMKKQTIFSFTGSSAMSSAHEALKILKQNCESYEYRYVHAAASSYREQRA